MGKPVWMAQICSKRKIFERCLQGLDRDFIYVHGKVGNTVRKEKTRKNLQVRKYAPFRHVNQSLICLFMQSDVI